VCCVLIGAVLFLADAEHLFVIAGRLLFVLLVPSSVIALLSVSPFALDQ
jgi:hypothetical protein